MLGGNNIEFIKKVYSLALPFGRRNLLVVMGFSLFQGVMQVIGVASVFPFLALAADPQGFRESSVGKIAMQTGFFDSDRVLLLSAGILAISMLLLSNGGNLLSEFFRARYVHSYGHWLRVRLLKKILSKPYASFLNSNTGVLQKKIVSDVIHYTIDVLFPLLDAIARSFTVLLLVVLLFAIDPVIALSVGLILGVFYAVIFRLLAKRRSEIVGTLHAADKKLFRELQHALGGVKTLKVHCAEEKYIVGFEGASKQQAKMKARLPVLSLAPRYMIEPLAFGGLVILVLIAMYRGEYLNDILPTVGVMALAGYRLIPAAQILYGQLTQMSAMRHTLEEVYDEFSEAESYADSESRANDFSSPEVMAWNSEIVFENVSFNYEEKSQDVLSNLNLTITKNSTLGIKGESGCGKSTLVDLLLGLHLPKSGRILIDGEPLTIENRRSWRMAVGYVPQDIFLSDATLAENVAFGIEPEDINMNEVTKACEAAQLMSLVNNDLEHGLNTLVGERGAKLSGGQRQRVGLARALYKNPSLLILDEATSALDTETENLVMEAINKLHGKMTIVAIAHRTKTIENFDSHLLLKKATPAV